MWGGGEEGGDRPRRRLLHARGRRENSLVALVEDDVHALVEPLQVAYDIAPVVGDDRDRLVDHLLKGAGHFREAILACCRKTTEGDPNPRQIASKLT